MPFYIYEVKNTYLERLFDSIKELLNRMWMGKYVSYVKEEGIRICERQEGRGKTWTMNGGVGCKVCVNGCVYCIYKCQVQFSLFGVTH